MGTISTQVESTVLRRLKLLQPTFKEYWRRVSIFCWTPEALLQGPSLGALAETAVIGEWVKAWRQAGEQLAFYYWQSSTSSEVGLIIDRSGVLYGLEVKATATPTPHRADALARWLELAGPTARGVLACRISRPQALRSGIRAMPWHLSWFSQP